LCDLDRWFDSRPYKDSTNNPSADNDPDANWGYNHYSESWTMPPKGRHPDFPGLKHHHDRTGRLRFYVGSIAIKARFGSHEFRAEYDQALASKRACTEARRRSTTTNMGAGKSAGIPLRSAGASAYHSKYPNTFAILAQMRKMAPELGALACRWRVDLAFLPLVGAFSVGGGVCHAFGFWNVLT
jgi:hypothetical protein